MRFRLLIALLAVSAVTVACGGDTSVFDLGVGDCFDDPATATDEVSSVATVDCAEPHDNEIYHAYQVDYPAFPGRTTMLEDAGEECVANFQAFVGRSFADSDLDVFPITPTQASWDDGDREVLCALYAMDLSKLTGTMRGSAR